MNIALFGTMDIQFKKVYTADTLKSLAQYGTLSKKIGKNDLAENAAFLKECEIAFSTWGMPQFTKQEIGQYMPKLKALFYAAGTVQYFAKPFLECGVKVFSAFAANAVPVAEYTFSQIVLANKGYYQAAKWYRLLPLRSLAFANAVGGNFKNKVGLVGLGAIGQMVAEKLMALDVEVFAYDPFVAKERAAELNVTLVEDLETIFKECNVVSNHLANKKELENIYTYKLFKSMKKHSTFINTGRGAQVCEYQLALQLLLHPSKTAVIDVLKREFIPYINPLFWCPNAIITPHIAGSTGNEPQRMAYYMIDELKHYLTDGETKYEVAAEDLLRMA